MKAPALRMLLWLVSRACYCVTVLGLDNVPDEGCLPAGSQIVRNSVSATLVVLLMFSLRGAAAASEENKPPVFTRTEMQEDLDYLTVRVNRAWAYADDKRTFLGVDIDALHTAALRKLDQVHDADDFYFVVKEYVGGLMDGHAGVQPGHSSARLSGLKRWPFELARLDGHFYVKSVAGETSLQPGDEILSVNSVALTNRFEVALGRSTGSTPGGRERRALDTMPYGTNTQLRIEAVHNGSNIICETTAQRDTAGEEPIRWKALERNIGYLRFPSFRQDMKMWENKGRGADALQAALEAKKATLRQAFSELKDTRALILDLRGNGGGSDALGHFLAHFLCDTDAHPIYYSLWTRQSEDLVALPDFAYRSNYPAAQLDDRTQVQLQPAPDVQRYRGKLAVLMDEGCFSACDCFLNYLSAAAPETIFVGRPDGAGAGAPRPVVTLPHSKMVVSFCVMQVWNPKNQLIESRPLNPTIPIKWTVADLRRGGDPDLEAALRYFGDHQKETSSSISNEAISRIRDEGLNHSQVMEILRQLTEGIGPRLTGSPNLKRANEWTRATLEQWGLTNAHLEAWGPFGRGWALTHFSAEVVEPEKIPLHGCPNAWSSGFEHPLVTNVVYLNVKTEGDLASYHGKLNGAIVLASLLGQDLPPTNGSGVDALPSRSRQRLLSFLVREGVAVVVYPSAEGGGGAFFVQAATVPASNPADPGQRIPLHAWSTNAPVVPPQITLAAKDYDRLARMARDGKPVRMMVDLQVRFYNEDLMAYNTIADIPGSDLRDQIVMIGAHLDSWHAATGATDNGAGVAATMEAIRILRALNLQPRRTIRIGLWSGEEQGFLGAQAYVSNHFAYYTGPSNPSSARKLVRQPDYDRATVYFNLDNGAGKIRGLYLQSNAGAKDIFRRWLSPVTGLGAGAIDPSDAAKTDHVPFDAVGIPAFEFKQDALDYMTRIHHSDQDVLGNVSPENLKQAAVVLAVVGLEAATVDENVPPKQSATVAIK